MQAPDGGD